MYVCMYVCTYKTINLYITNVFVLSIVYENTIFEYGANTEKIDFYILYNVLICSIHVLSFRKNTCRHIVTSAQ